MSNNKNNALTKLQYQVHINASPEHVHQVMLNLDTYKAWTKHFNPTSTFAGTWEKGTKMHFLGIDEQGKVGGMVSRIKEHLPNQFVSIEHLGILRGDEEILSGPEVEAWAGGLEEYLFTESNQGTLLSIAVDTNHEYTEYFDNTWPQALQALKSLCENNTN
jgi:hypothetical protein